MDVRIPPLKTNVMLESNPLKFIILVRRLAVWRYMIGVYTGYLGKMLCSLRAHIDMMDRGVFEFIDMTYGGRPF